MTSRRACYAERSSGQTIQKNGWVSPIDIYSADEIADIRSEIEEAEKDWPEALSGPGRNNAHLVLPVLDRIAHEPRILDAVEQLIGHDILITSTTLFIKDPHTKGFVSWHQDARYVGLEPHNWVTAWLAVTDVNEENGCMYMLPGSHEQPLVEHDDTYGEDNILTRGQTIHGVDEASTYLFCSRPGNSRASSACHPWLRGEQQFTPADRLCHSVLCRR